MNETQDLLYRDFLALWQRQASTLEESTAAYRSVTDAVTKTAGAAAGAAQRIETRPDSSGGDGRGIADIALGIATSVLKNAGLSPVIKGLIGLFGGGDDDQEPAPLLKYALPPAIQFRGARTQTGINSVDYDQSGMPRAFGAAWREPTAGTGPQITVNVQAMDSRSFLDHSNEIAAAVREAMLNLNSINDVVAEL